MNGSNGMARTEQGDRATTSPAHLLAASGVSAAPITSGNGEDTGNGSHGSSGHSNGNGSSQEDGTEAKADQAMFRPWEIIRLVELLIAANWVVAIKDRTEEAAVFLAQFLRDRVGGGDMTEGERRVKGALRTFIGRVQNGEVFAWDKALAFMQQFVHAAARGVIPGIKETSVGQTLKAEFERVSRAKLAFGPVARVKADMDWRERQAALHVLISEEQKRGKLAMAHDGLADLLGDFGGLEAVSVEVPAEENPVRFAVQGDLLRVTFAELAYRGEEMVGLRFTVEAGIGFSVKMSLQHAFVPISRLGGRWFKVNNETMEAFGKRLTGVFGKNSRTVRVVESNTGTLVAEIVREEDLVRQVAGIGDEEKPVAPRRSRRTAEPEQERRAPRKERRVDYLLVVENVETLRAVAVEEGILLDESGVVLKGFFEKAEAGTVLGQDEASAAKTFFAAIFNGHELADAAKLAVAEALSGVVAEAREVRRAITARRRVLIADTEFVCVVPPEVDNDPRGIHHGHAVFVIRGEAARQINPKLGGLLRAVVPEDHNYRNVAEAIATLSESGAPLCWTHAAGGKGKPGVHDAVLHILDKSGLVDCPELHQLRLMAGLNEKGEAHIYFRATEVSDAVMAENQRRMEVVTTVERDVMSGEARQRMERAAKGGAFSENPRPGSEYGDSDKSERDRKLRQSMRGPSGGGGGKPRGGSSKKGGKG